MPNRNSNFRTHFLLITKGTLLLLGLLLFAMFPTVLGRVFRRASVMDNFKREGRSRQRVVAKTNKKNTVYDQALVLPSGGFCEASELHSPVCHNPNLPESILRMGFFSRPKQQIITISSAPSNRRIVFMANCREWGVAVSNAPDFVRSFRRTATGPNVVNTLPILFDQVSLTQESGKEEDPYDERSMLVGNVYRALHSSFIASISGVEEETPAEWFRVNFTFAAPSMRGERWRKDVLDFPLNRLVNWPLCEANAYIIKQLRSSLHRLWLYSQNTLMGRSAHGLPETTGCPIALPFFPCRSLELQKKWTNTIITGLERLRSNFSVPEILIGSFVPRWIEDEQTLTPDIEARYKDYLETGTRTEGGYITVSVLNHPLWAQYFAHFPNGNIPSYVHDMIPTDEERSFKIVVSTRPNTLKVTIPELRQAMVWDLTRDIASILNRNDISEVQKIGDIDAYLGGVLSKEQLNYIFPEWCAWYQTRPSLRSLIDEVMLHQEPSTPPSRALLEHKDDPIKDEAVLKKPPEEVFKPVRDDGPGREDVAIHHAKDDEPIVTRDFVQWAWQ